MTRTDAGLRRSLGVRDAVVVGLGSMIGAGVFSALGPAARAAGSGLLPALGLAAVVAYCNAMSSARLAARYPPPAGSYVYGRERLGAFWGYLAGWAFVVGKTASCAAMALTVGAYVWPGQAHAVAVAAVVALTAVNYGGIQKSAWLTRAIVAVVLAVLAAVVVGCLASGRGRRGAAGHRAVGGRRRRAPGGRAAVLRVRRVRADRHARGGGARSGTHHSAGHPAGPGDRPLAVYACVAVAVLGVLGAGPLGQASAPLADAVRAAGAPGLVPVVRAGAAVAALGSLLALILGVSRTTLAMARDGHLPGALAADAPAVPGAAPGRAGRGRGGRRAGRDGGRTRRDRLLVLRCARVLRRRQRLGLDAERGAALPGWCPRWACWAAPRWRSRCPPPRWPSARACSRRAWRPTAYGAGGRAGAGRDARTATARRTRACSAGRERLIGGGRSRGPAAAGRPGSA